MGEFPPFEGAPHLQLTVETDAVRRFAPLLGQGVIVEIPGGKTLRQVLCDVIGVPDRYVDTRIQTAFRNGHPVDRISEALIFDGDTVALSAAMPGLVGATMRMGGRYAALRREISLGIEEEPNTANFADKIARIRIKCFNFVAEEIAGEILGRGVGVPGAELQSFLAGREKTLGPRIRSALLDGNRLPAHRPSLWVLGHGLLRFTLLTERAAV